MDSAVAHLEKELAAVRAGRANPAILDKLSVDYYGVPTPIQQVATVAVTEARTLTIQPWESSLLRAIEKAILTSDIGINPTNDGKVIRLNFPALTEERRKELVKQVKKMTEDAKVAARNIRRDTLDTLKKLKNAKEITEDELNDFTKTVEDSVTDAISKIEKASSEKEKDVMTV
jgi:ribosome recycling factor